MSNRSAATSDIPTGSDEFRHLDRSDAERGDPAVSAHGNELASNKLDGTCL